MAKGVHAVVADVERIYGYDGSPVVPVTGGSFLYPSASGVATLFPTASAEKAKFWGMGDGVHQISTIAINRSQTLLVAAERRLKVTLQVYSYPSRKLLQQIPDAGKVEIADMAFSRDGTFLAVLSGPPACSLSIYTVDASTNRLSLYMGPTEQFGHHLRRVSFSPVDPEVVCGSGGGHCVFWSMDTASATLRPLEGTVQVPNTRITSHQWMPDGSLICGTTGVGLVHYMDLTAPVGVPIGPQSGAVADVCLTKSHLITLSPEGAVAFYSAANATTSHTSLSDAPVRTITTGVQKAAFIRLVPENNALVVGGAGGRLVYVALPGYDGTIGDDEFSLLVPKSVPLQLGFGGPLVGLAHGKGSSMGVVSKVGLCTVLDYNANAITSSLHIGIEPIAVGSINKCSALAVTSQTGCLRVVSFADVSSPKIVFKGRFSDTQLHLVASDPTGAVLVAADSQYLFFFDITDEGARVAYIGCVRLTNVMGVNAIAFLPDGSGFLISHSSGDTVLFNIPTADMFTADNNALLMLEQSSIFVNSWRLDTPVFTFAVASAYAEYLNIITQSMDKGGRLYLFDRTLSADRKDRESRVIKPQVVSADHEKKGTRIRIAFSKFILSAGADGKLCVRDAINYTKPLTPQPLSKERTEPLAVAQCHASLRGGIASFCLGFDGSRRIITAGVDGYVAVWNIPIPAIASGPLQSPSLKVTADLSVDPLTAPDADDELYYSDKTRREAEAIDSLRYQSYRETVQRRIDVLRTQLEQIREENSGLGDDEKVDLEDFLVQRHRAVFEASVDAAVRDMKGEVELSNLRRDYLADLIKRECWDVMEVKLTPLVALNTPGLVVHNFHQRRADVVSASIVRKLKFLRVVEETDRRHRKVHELEGVYDGPKEDPFFTNYVGHETPADGKGAAKDKGDQQQDKEGQEETHTDYVEELTSKPILEQAAEDPAPYLYNPLLAFTRSRSTIQKMLLQGRIHSLKNSFNAEFNALVDRKHTELHQIKERNARCRLVLKELGEEKEIFSPALAIIEDPAYIFTVDESKITDADKSTDPEEKRRLAQLEAERLRWIERNGTDGSSDRALKVWMDGRLDKDIRTLEVNVPLPDFADETNVDRYVPPDERNDDQTRIYKDYETALQKRIEEVTLRRGQLRNEFDKLQKDNIAAAKLFDEAVRDLFQRRLLVSQHCSHVELSQIKLVQAVLMQDERLRIARTMEQRRKALSDHLQRINKAFHKATAVYERVAAEVSARREEERVKEKSIKAYAPFTDPEYGDRLVKHYNRKMRAKRKAATEAAAANGGDSTLPVVPAKMPIINPTQDPFGFIEVEAQLKAQQQQVLQSIESMHFSEEQFASEGQYLPAGLIVTERPGGDVVNVPEALWQMYMAFRNERNIAEHEINVMAGEQAEAESQLAIIKSQRTLISDALSESVRTFELFLSDSVEEQYDIDDIYVMQQGQVEVDQAPVVMNFDDAVMVRTSVADRLNGLIRESNDEKLAAMADRMMRLKEISLIEWEVEFYVFAMRSLELQLKHLHTLRVTKQMQAFINGGGEDHKEHERQKLAVKIEHVRSTMASKIDDRRQQMLKLRRAIKDKEVENYILQDQVGESKALVDDRRAIRELQSSDLDQVRSDKLMRDMRVTRKLEDVAKAQQSEMSTMKKEIDRLRERTFPSFAVVSKRVVGNPDQL